MYDTRVAGNSNQGHRYGTDLSASDRKALLEYLKVMDPPDMFGPAGSLVSAGSPGVLPRIAPVVGQASPGLGIEKIPANETKDIQELNALQLEQMTNGRPARSTENRRIAVNIPSITGSWRRGSPSPRPPRGTAGWPFPRAEDLLRRDPLLQYRRTR